MTIFSDFKRVALQQPDSPAVIMQDSQVSYSAVLKLSEQIAGGLLKVGFHKGDRVAIHIGNRPELISVYYACLQIGAVILPISLRLSGGEIKYLLSHGAARFYLGDAELYERWTDAVNQNNTIEYAWVLDLSISNGRAKPWKELLSDTGFAPVEVRPDDISSIFYTSGTTGLPKAIAYSHATLSNALDLMDHTLDSTKDPRSARGDAVHSMVDVISPWTILALLTGLRRGRPAAITPTHNGDVVLALLNKHQIGWLGGAPSNFAALVSEIRRVGANAPDLSETNCVSGGDSCPVDLAKAFFDIFKANLQSSYGLTETCGPVTFQPNLNAVDAPSIGWPLPGVEIKIDAPTGEAGELFLRSPARPIGFWNGSSVDACDTERWLPSGDYVQQRSDGCLIFLGRKKDDFMVEGYPVSPLDVEKKLVENADIAAAIVFGVPDEIKGERGIAIVEAIPGRQLSAQDIMAHLSGRMANYKLPREIYIMEKLPFGANGKRSRKQLTADYAVSAGPFSKQKEI